MTELEVTIAQLESEGRYLGRYHSCSFYEFNGRFYFIPQSGLFREVYQRTWGDSTPEEIARWLETWVLPDENQS